MKFFSIITVTLFAICSFSCSKKGPELLDPNAKVYINSSETKAPTATDYLTALEVVQQADIMYCSAGSMGIGDWQRDTENVRLAVGSTWVVSSEGELVTHMIEARDYYFVLYDIPTDKITDTVAYIPNSVMADIEPKIKAAYAVEDYATCYKLFEESFVFTPINGKDWKALKEQGLN